MFRVLPPSLLALCYMALTSSVWALPESLKSAVLEDCAKARAAFIELDSRDYGALAEFLAQVMWLKVQSLPPEMVPALLPGMTAGPGELGRANLWRSFDSNSETRSKRCAVAIAESLGAPAIGTLPAIVEIISDQTNGTELALEAHQALLKIAQLRSDPLSEGLRSQLTEQLSGNTLGSARLALLAAPHADTASQLTALMEVAPPERLNTVADIIRIILNSSGGDRAIEERLSKLLKKQSDNQALGAAVLRALSFAGKAEKQHAELLIANLTNQSDNMRTAARAGISRLKNQRNLALSAIYKALKSSGTTSELSYELLQFVTEIASDQNLQRFAPFYDAALAKESKLSSGLATSLLRLTEPSLAFSLLQSKNEQVRRRAADWLAALNSNSKMLRKILLQELASGDCAKSLASAQDLLLLRPAIAQQEIERAMLKCFEYNGSNELHAAVLLTKLKSPSANASRKLSALFNDAGTDPLVFLGLWNSELDFNRASMMPRLHQLLESTDGEILSAAALAAQRAPAATTELLSLLDDAVAEHDAPVLSRCAALSARLYLTQEQPARLEMLRKWFERREDLPSTCLASADAAELLALLESPWLRTRFWAALILVQVSDSREALTKAAQVIFDSPFNLDPEHIQWGSSAKVLLGKLAKQQTNRLHRALALFAD